jgi:hypothetical protein
MLASAFVVRKREIIDQPGGEAEVAEQTEPAAVAEWGLVERHENLPWANFRIISECFIG